MKGMLIRGVDERTMQPHKATRAIYLAFTFRLTLTMATANLLTSVPVPMDLGEMASGKSNSIVIPLASTSSFGMVACNR